MRAVFITEGTKNIGFGHITRCLAIAQAFEEKKIETLLIINGDESILQLLKKENYKIIDWIKSEGKLFDLIKKDDLVFIDSYLANKNFYKKINKLVKQAVYIDDNNRLSYPKGIIINGNLHAASLPYPKKKDLTYLLGPKYAPIRKEFWDFSFKNINKKVKNILITFGGDDKRNLTPKVLSLLQKNYPNINYKVIIGKGFKNKLKIKKLITNKIKLVTDPNPEQIRNLMINCDIAVSASGQTTLELLRLRIPTIIIVVADNQENIAKILTKKLLVEYAGNWKEKSLLLNLNKKLKKLNNYEVRKNIFNSQVNIVDGQGPRRIVDFIVNKKPVKILFLTNNNISLDLVNWLKDIQKENVIIYNKKLTKKIIKKLKPDFLVSYNYKYIIKGEILNLFSKGKAMNLHISYLPWNKGSNPNFWSFFENTPSGVTIHVLDEGIDTGNIIIQKRIYFGTNETLISSYLRLNKSVTELFKKNWIAIKNNTFKPKPQRESGSYHNLEEYNKVYHVLGEKKWDTTIEELKRNKKLNKQNIIIRKAEPKDLSQIFRLSNGPEIRKKSFNQDIISKKFHEKWFFSKLKEKNYAFFIAENDLKILGQVRGKLIKDEYAVEINISVLRQYQRKGIGKKLFFYLNSYIKNNFPFVNKIIALIKIDNKNSIRFFQSLGFKKSKEILVKKNKAFEYILDI